MERKSICIVITASMNLHSLYREQFIYLIENKYDVTAIASPGIEHEWIRAMGVKTIEIPIERRPSPFKDLVSITRLWSFFRKNKFDLIIISTPKASLLGIIAAKLANVKNIVYMIRGRAYENFSGFSRTLYAKIDTFICRNSDYILSISHELKGLYIKEGIAEADKIRVLGSGSSNGVDLKRFNINNFSKESQLNLRKKLSIYDDDFVYIYCGRLRKDKGTHELITAFKKVQEKSTKVKLLLLGSFEKFDSLDDDIINDITNNKNIILVEWAKDVESYFSISNVLVFPSHREGFGNVAIEASAMSLPVIGYNVIGLRESISNGYSGVLVTLSDVRALADEMLRFKTDTEFAESIGSNGRSYVETHFENRKVWANLVQFYDEICQ